MKAALESPEVMSKSSTAGRKSMMRGEDAGWKNDFRLALMADTKDWLFMALPSISVSIYLNSSCKAHKSPTGVDTKIVWRADIVKMRQGLTWFLFEIKKGKLKKGRVTLFATLCSSHR
jgi:hypothetical protein